MQDVLFAKIQLTPTLTHLESLENADISRFGPYVKKINFVTPLCSWTLGYDAFEEIVIAQAILKHASDLNPYPWERLYSSVGDCRQQRQEYIDKHLNGVSPLSEKQIQAGFQTYRAEGEAANRFLHSDALRAAWTRVLQKLPRARSFHFSSPGWENGRGDHLPLQPDCVIRAHQHCCLHYSEPCARALAVVGDAVFAAGIACLSEAGIQVEALKIANIVTTSLGWEHLPGWESLNLTSMRKLEFEPQVGTRTDYLGCTEYKESSITQRIDKIIASVLKKCGSYLEYFSAIPRDCPILWPGEEIIPLPRLLHLKLVGVWIIAPSFKKWMAGMPSLQELVLGSIILTGEYREWLDIFDAIRDHPKSMKVCFDQVYNCDWAELSIDYDTGDYERILEMEEGEDWIDDNDRSLSLYLSGKGGYDRILRDMLQDDPEEEEEYDEYDENVEDEIWDDEDLNNELSNSVDSNLSDLSETISGCRTTIPENPDHENGDD